MAVTFNVLSILFGIRYSAWWTTCSTLDGSINILNLKVNKIKDPTFGVARKDKPHLSDLFFQVQGLIKQYTCTRFKAIM